MAAALKSSSVLRSGIKHSSTSSKATHIPVINEKALSEHQQGSQQKAAPPRKTIAEQDAELRAKLEERSGDGGAAGLELEDGKPVAMKRGVKENMFRLI